MNDSVKNYGAAGDGKTNDTAAVQAAIDAAFAAGGGVITFPAGRYLCAGLFLRSHVYLNLEPGCVLQADRDPEHYDPRLMEILWLDDGRRRCIFLYADGQEDLKIYGGGTVEGCGQEDFGSWWGLGEKPPVRVATLLLENCRDITLEGVRFLYSDFWTLHFRKCENLRVLGVTVHNNPRRLNTDGINPDSCKNVLIRDCILLTGDDCIAIKAVPGKASENILIQNCIMETPCTAVKLGTESRSDFRDIHVQNCAIRRSAVGIGIYIKDGATAERVSFSNISIESGEEYGAIKPVVPLFADIERRMEDSPIGRIRDVSFDHIQIASAYSCVFQGMPGHPIENLSVSDIQLRVNGCAVFEKRKKPVTTRRFTSDERDTKFIRRECYAAFAHIKGLRIRDVSIVYDTASPLARRRSGLLLHDVQDARVQEVYRQGEEENWEKLIVTE